MKRCTQCDFLYEDDQKLCDMDGNLLVLDNASTTCDPDVSTSSVTAKPKSIWRLFGILVLPALVLGALLPVIFQGLNADGASPALAPVSIDANHTGATDAPPPVVQPDAPSPLPSPEESKPTETPSPLRDKSAEPNGLKPENKAVVSMAKASAAKAAMANEKSLGDARAKEGGIQLVVVSSKRSGEFATQPVVARNREVKQPQASVKTKVSEEKKPSRFGSFLKTTGRILKKPFKR